MAVRIAIALFILIVSCGTEDDAPETTADVTRRACGEALGLPCEDFPEACDELERVQPFICLGPNESDELEEDTLHQVTKLTSCGAYLAVGPGCPEGTPRGGQ